MSKKKDDLTENEPKKRRGCGGCFVTLLVLILILAVGAGGLYLFRYKDNGGIEQAKTEALELVEKARALATNVIISIKGNHEHDWTEWRIVTEPTCTEEGWKTRTCKICGEIGEMAIDPNGHSFSEWDIIIAPTCTETGKATHVCTVCGAEGEKILAPNEHDYESSTIRPTCLTGGYTHNVCKVCGYEMDNQQVGALGHSYAIDATCIDRECLRDGCDHIEYKTTDHVFGDWKTDEPAATCTTAGKLKRTCINCECNYEYKDQAALGHDQVLLSTTATCTAGGEESWKCKRCNDIEQRPVGALGHLYADEYTCHDRACLRQGCDYVSTGDGIHDLGEVVTPYNCTEDGYTTHTCKNCGYSYIDTIVPTPYGTHQYIGSWIPLSDGSGRKKICNRCTYAWIQYHHSVTTTTIGNDVTLSGAGNYYPDDDVTISAVLPDGYQFDGWYIDSTLQSSSKSYNFVMDEEAHSFEAKWSLIQYSITYHMDGGTVNGSNPTNYDTLHGGTLLPATKSGYTFVGWYTSDSYTVSISNLAGQSENLDLYAYFTLDVILSFHDLDGISFESIVASAGTPIDEPTLDPADEIGGYVIDWYTDSALTTPFTFDVMPAAHTELWGKWRYIIGSFMDYYEEFTSDSISIDNDAEFSAYIEFLRFYKLKKADLTTAQKNLTFSYLSSAAVKSALDRTNDQSTYSGTFNLSYPDGTITWIAISDKDDPAEQATLTAAAADKYVQYGYMGYDKTRAATRANDFSDFAINKAPYSMTVNTSDDLVYALEHGFRPLPVANSGAQKMYDKACAVLRKIIDDEMTDLQKTKAIYEWLIMEVAYDFDILDLVDADWRKYDAYYLEGVFNKGRAVCDGVSKAFVTMCAIEGIPAVRVTGNSTIEESTSGHAWNKVYLSGKWYVVDATWGNTLTGDHEAMYYTHFLQTDAQKTALGCAADNYLYLSAVDGTYDYYSSTSFTYSEDGGITTRTFDLNINNADEMSSLLSYYIAYCEGDNSTFYPDGQVTIAFRKATASELSSLMGSASMLLNARTGRSLKNYFLSELSDNVYSVIFNFN